MSDQRKITSTERQKGKLFIGTVVAVRSNNTATVAVSSSHRHPLYRKSVIRTKRFAVHNPGVDLAIGDLVQISETRPVSKTKYFVIVGKAKS